MKIKAIESILKSAKRIIIYRFGEMQFLGDGSAIYPIYNLPRLTDKHIFSLFDIPEDKQGKYCFEERELPNDISFEEFLPGDKLIQRGKLTICVLGRDLEPLKTSKGTVFINSKHLKPFADEDGGFELYERATAQGDIRIVVKKGMLLIGIITPFNINGEGFIEELEQIVTGSKNALQNNGNDNPQLSM